MDKEESEGYATPGKGSAKHSAPITRLMGGRVEWGDKGGEMAWMGVAVVEEERRRGRLFLSEA